MKRLLLLLTLCFPVLLFSQQAVTSAGGIGIGGTSSFSLGQVAYSSFNIIGVGSINEGVLQPPPPLSLSLNRTNVTCNGGSDGTLSAIATGGTPPYTYEWVDYPSVNTQTITGVPARSAKYFVKVIDAMGSMKSKGNRVKEPDAITISFINEMDADCAGGQTGTSTAQPTGGVGSYTYAWSNGNTSSTASSLSAGGYNVTVTDGDGCTGVAGTEIGDPSGLQLSVIQITHPTCNGASDGFASIEVVGGNGPFAVTNVRRNNTVIYTSPTGLAFNAGNIWNGNPNIAGHYYIEVTDANDCKVYISVTLEDPDELVSYVESTDVQCNGDSDGTVTVYASGGTKPYEYEWSHMMTYYTMNNSATGFSAGEYTVTITDANDCSTTNTVTIVEPDELTISVDKTDVSCNGGSDGFIDITVSGGTSPYSYDWVGNNYDPADDSQDAQNIPAGKYTVTVTDANGCTDTRNNIRIRQATKLTVSIGSVMDADCAGIEDGSATASGMGGTGDITCLVKWRCNSNSNSTQRGRIFGNRNR